MIKILFICHGNICRSTMAEFVFRDMVRRAGREDEFYIESAATSREEIGNDTHPGTKGKLRENGIPFERHYARQVTKANRSIADPWYTGNFDETYDDVIEGCEALLEELL